MRKYRGDNPSKFNNWDGTEVDEPITNQSQQQRREKQREKRKKKRQRRKERKQKEREEEKNKKHNDSVEEDEEGKISQDEEEDEEDKCDYCGRLKSSLPRKKTMLISGNNIYCSAECLKLHRRDLMAKAAEERLK